jgi:hypothetical protein
MAMFSQGIGESPLPTSPRWSTRARVFLVRNTAMFSHRDCESEKEKAKFDQMLQDHKKLLYPSTENGQKKLGTTLKLLQWKAENGISDKVFGKLPKIQKKDASEA